MDDTISGNIAFEYATFGQCSGCGGKSVDRMIRETTPLGSIGYSYDALGRRTSMTVAGESPVEYTYYENGRLTGVAHGDIGTALMEYDDAGRRTLLTLPNGTATSYAYDASSRLLALTHAGASGTIEKPTYTYNAAGNRVNFSTSNPQAELPAVVTAAVDAANRLLSHNEENLTYDANGNLVAGTDASGTTTYTWDARNRLVAIEGPSVTASFKYDAFNRRTEKTVNDKRTQYLYDGVDIIAEVEDGIITAKYLRSLSIDEVFARMDSTGRRYYHKDGLGSTVALTDSSGHVTTRYTYGPFGETTAAGDADANPFQYTGREWDQQTGLYYYRARYYDPRWGRFISEDPIRFAGGNVNLYAYVGNQPINRIDPLGLDWLYEQSTGQLSYQPPDFIGGGPPEPVATGYAGNGDAANNPDCQCKKNEGPLPRGKYTIGPLETHYTHGHVLKNSMRLTPCKSNNMCNPPRSSFLIHDDIGSNGCIVIPDEADRLRIGNSSDKVLVVY